MSSRLVSGNVGLPRKHSWKGRTFRTGIWKDPIAGRRMAATAALSPLSRTRQAAARVADGGSKQLREGRHLVRAGAVPVSGRELPPRSPAPSFPGAGPVGGFYEANKDPDPDRLRDNLDKSPTWTGIVPYAKAFVETVNRYGGNGVASAASRHRSVWQHTLRVLGLEQRPVADLLSEYLNQHELNRQGYRFAWTGSPLGCWRENGLVDCVDTLLGLGENPDDQSS